MFKMPVRRQQSSESSSTRSNEGFIFLRCGKNANTVQTSWRPQLPLPKEVQHTSDENAIENSKYDSNESLNDMERLHSKKDKDRVRDRDRDGMLNSSQLSNASGGSTSKKWSFGRLFRRKKEVSTESSSEEDRKAGFQPIQKFRHGSGSSKAAKTKNPKNLRGSKLIGAGFDNIAVNPAEQQSQQKLQYNQRHHQQHHHIDNELFLPVETIPANQHEPYYQNQTNQHPNQQKQQFFTQAMTTPQQTQQLSRSSNSLDRRAMRVALPKTRSTQRLAVPGSTGARSSSEEEIISLHSSTFSKYRSDESIHSGGQALNGTNGGQSRRSRAARNERYFKRLSRDGEMSHGQVPVMYAPQPTQRWKTQPVPLSIFNDHNQSQAQTNLTQKQAMQKLVLPGQSASPMQPLQRNAGSLQHMAPYVQWSQTQQQQQEQPPKNLQNSVNESKRSISYDSHIHLQNINGRLQTKPLPPPPPPRDPLRRVQITSQGLSGSGQPQNGSSCDLRPLSYAFDQQGAPIKQKFGLINRCVSDDKIWAHQMSHHYQSAHSLNMPANITPHTTLSRRYGTRAERDAHPGKTSLPNGLDFHYVADAAPRSRKPIHMLDFDEAKSSNPPSSGVVRTTKSGLPALATKNSATDFWKNIDKNSQTAQRRGRDFERTPIDEALKPRSISSSRIGEFSGYTVPIYSEIYKPRNQKVEATPTAQRQNAFKDEVENVVCGSLHIKPGTDSTNNYVEIRRHKDFNKCQSMPNGFEQQRRSGGELTSKANKYEEYVAEKRELHHKPIFNPPLPPQRKLSIPPDATSIYFPRKKPANLEEAISELEAIYRSLGLTEEPDKRERVPTPSENAFEKYAMAHADDYDEEDSPTGEPDPVRDDAALRNMQLANLQHKKAEKQPPFGIPIGPIVPAPQSDYLHVTPFRDKVQTVPSKITPDIVKDDLAVRMLRKDPPGPKEKFVYPTNSLQKKNRATRTQSANIYSLIQRDAAKPAGGDLYSLMELTRSVDRAGSMSDLRKDGSDDVPATLTLLRNLKAQDEELHASSQKRPAQIPFRHPSQGGAICQLPEKLTYREEVHKAPVPLPRKSLTPEPAFANSRMEDALNKIAKDAQESSVKLTKELQELRREALITASRQKLTNPEEEKLEKELQEIEAVSEAAKRCGKMLLDTLPDAEADEKPATAKPRKLHKEGKLIEAIDQVSEAANAVCEKILKDIVTTEPPVVVQEAVKVKNKTHLEPLVNQNQPNIDDESNKSESIAALAKRCVRELNELTGSPDYDNLTKRDEMQGTALPASAPACNKKLTLNSLDAQISSVTEAKTNQVARPAVEEIDKVMLECKAQVKHQRESSKSSDLPLSTVHSSTESTSKAMTAVAVASNTSSKTNSSSSSSNNNAASSAVAPSTSTTAPTTVSSNAASSFSSSSDCLAKSSSPSASRRMSSSITSFNPYSSSDYIKSPSSEYHALSTDPIKTFSTTSYDVQSTSATPNITTTSTFSYSPSPPLNLTPVSGRARTADAATAVTLSTDAERNSTERARSSSPSQYNSSEELAMIFGIEEKPRNRQHTQQQHQSESETQNITGKVGTRYDKIPLTLPLSMSLLSLSSSNHASSSSACSPASEPITIAPSCYSQAACYNCYACHKQRTEQNNVELGCLCNTNITISNSKRSKNNQSNQNNKNTNITNFNSPTNANRCCSCSSPANASSYKLETIPEQYETNNKDPANNIAKNIHNNNNAMLKLSPNFNKIYASEISILIDKNITAVIEAASKVETNSSAADKNNSPIQYDLLSSLEESSSNPDSGNVSLADYPLAVNSNVCLELQTPCNTRYELKSNYVTEVYITDSNEQSNEIQIDEVITEEVENLDELGFPRLPTEKELADSLKEVVDEPELCEALVASKRSVVFETPQINMNILEVRLNYEEEVIEDKINEAYNTETSANDSDLMTQIAQCNEEIEKLSQVLKQMPQKRSIEQRQHESMIRMNIEEPNHTMVTMRQTIDLKTDNNCRERDDVRDSVANHNNPTEAMPIARFRQHRITSSQSLDECEDNTVEKASTSGSDSITADAISLFGELRPANNSTSLTTLEHVLLACSLGVISSNDLFTLFLIIIGIVTIITIVLY